MREYIKLIDVDDIIMFMEIREDTKAYATRSDFDELISSELVRRLEERL
jgi:hypothetical protein